MAAPTNYYVDPAIAANSGTGTIGDPYGDLQYALDTITRNATDGDQINVKAGTAEILAAALTLATYGTPTTSVPLIIRGYTSAANDGGVGEVSGNNSVAVHSAGGVISWRDMKLGDCGSNTVLSLANGSYVYGCEIHTTTGSGIAVAAGASVISALSYFHNIGAVGVTSGTGNHRVFGCYFANGTNSFTSAISLGLNGVAKNNIISIGGSSIGITVSASNATVIGNSILSAGGTGSGIEISAVLANLNIANNLIEGFSGAGGTGVDFNTTSIAAALYAGNAAYNNTTNYAQAGDSAVFTDVDNETLGATPFAKSGSDTFANRFTYFAPANTGNVRRGAYPFDGSLSKGAVQAGIRGLNMVIGG